VLIGEGEQPRDYPDLPGFDGKGAALIVPILSSGTRPGADRFAPAEWTSTPIGAFSIFTGPDEQRDFDQSDWDKKVLSILGHYAALAVQSLAQQEALRLAQEQRATTEAFAAIGDIAANLLHRLNNKIGTIPVRVEGIQDKSSAALKEDGYLEKNLAEIERSAVEAMEVVRESLYHLHPIQLSPVSVAGSVREAQASARLPQGVTLEIENLDHLPPVQAGPKRLGLVFSNLFENAVDAMSSEGVIRVSGRTENGRVEVRVSDTGPGIEPDLHERVFEFNYSARASAHPGKLGFGLWWVKSLMARFGGTVTVESDGQNGTTFILTLPQAVEDEWQIA
jgi:signal transduction histidine kinase